MLPPTDRFACVFALSLVLADPVPLLPVADPAPAGNQPVQALPLLRTDPGHLGPRVLPPERPQNRAPRTRYDAAGTVIYNFPDELAGHAAVDWELSRLCRRGAFTQTLDGRLYVRTPRQRYGVAVAGGANLHDPQGKATADTVYFFSASDTSRCTVWRARETDLSAFRVSTKP